ncbi:MAG: PAS domain S-box protein, partial [Nevskiales bacterium]|nr:PAS domain S-box protein [Nevskiales bacterium]
MPASLPQAATLLILSPGEETARRIESHLRGAGQPVRAIWVTDLEDFEEVLRRRPPDLVLCAEDAPLAGPKDVLKLCTRLAPDLPILMITTAQNFTPADTAAAVKAGARDLVALGNPHQLNHLELVCARELAAHQRLRELRNARARLADFEARYKQIMAETGDAVFHVQEGIIVYANDAFASLLGYSSPVQLEGNPMMDLVAPDNQP